MSNPSLEPTGSARSALATPGSSIGSCAFIVLSPEPVAQFHRYPSPLSSAVSVFIVVIWLLRFSARLTAPFSSVDGRHKRVSTSLAFQHAHPRRDGAPVCIRARPFVGALYCRWYRYPAPHHSVTHGAAHHASAANGGLIWFGSWFHIHGCALIRIPMRWSSNRFLTRRSVYWSGVISTHRAFRLQAVQHALRAVV